MHSVDFLIIGQGLAGSLLAFELVQRGKSVLVIDDHHRAAASKVAAGLINPVTGHRLNITNNFYNYQDVAIPFYRNLEKKLGISVYQELNQTRLIKNQGQFEYLQKRLQETQYQPILKNHQHTEDWFNDKEAYPHGAINVGQTAVVDTTLLLGAINHWLTSNHSLSSDKFQYKLLNVSDDTVSYQDVKASKVIFCEGFQAVDNPWLAHLPFKTAKGEILTVRTTNCELDRMLSWGQWLVPFKDGKAKLGSNYLWNDHSLTISKSTSEDFLNSLRQFTGIEADLVEHQVGIRPSTTQRNPFVGKLSKLDNAYCFNGLGAKGCLLAPYFSQLLVDHMLSNRRISQEFTRWL